MDNLQIAKKAVLDCNKLPSIIRDNIESIELLDSSEFDSTYIEFLDEQIELNARGKDWTERLSIRKKNLINFVDTLLLNIQLKVEKEEFCLKVEPNSKKVVHWERY